MSGGELFEKVAADNFELTEAEVVVFMREITEGARYIHQQVSVANFYKKSLCEPLIKCHQTCIALPSKGEALHTFPDFGGGGRSDPPAFMEGMRRGVSSPPVPFCSSPFQLLKECL